MKQCIDRLKDLFSGEFNVVSDGDNECKNSLAKTIPALTLAATMGFAQPALADNPAEVSALNDSFSSTQLSQIAIDSIRDSFEHLSVDFNNDYMNNKHPIMSRVNEYLEFARENYEPEKLAAIEGHVNATNKLFQSNIVEQMKYAEPILSLSDDKPIRIVPAAGHGFESLDELYYLQTSYKRLMENMNAEPDFKYASDWEINNRLSARYHSVEKTGGNFKSDAYFNSVVSNGYDIMSLAPLWVASSGGDYDKMMDIMESLHETASSMTELMQDAYELNDLEREIHMSSTTLHEFGHKYTAKGAGSVRLSEFSAEVMRVYSAVQSGAGQNYLDLTLDTNNVIYGIDLDEGSHGTIGLLSEFYRDMSVEDIRSFSAKEMADKSIEFYYEAPDSTQSVDRNVDAYLYANNKLIETGAFPKLAKYLEDHPEIEDYGMRKAIKTINDNAPSGEYNERIGYINKVTKEPWIAEIFYPSFEEANIEVKGVNDYLERMTELGLDTDNIEKPSYHAKVETKRFDMSNIIDDPEELEAIYGDRMEANSEDMTGKASPPKTESLAFGERSNEGAEARLKSLQNDVSNDYDSPGLH